MGDVNGGPSACLCRDASCLLLFYMFQDHDTGLPVFFFMQPFKDRISRLFTILNDFRKGVPKTPIT